MRRRLPLLLPLVVAVAAACTGGGHDDSGEPPPSTVGTATTTTVDFSAVHLSPVRGVTTTTIAIAGGEASLAGATTGPDGAVPGGVVRVERLVEDSVASVDVPVGLDGRWQLDGIKGGRYRVRAWRAPDLVTKASEVLFLQGHEKRQLDLRLDLVGGTRVSTAIAPDPPVVGRPAELAVLVATAVVDDQGEVQGEPVPHALVDLVGSGSWRVDSANPAVTGADGVVKWDVRCLETGQQPLAVRVDGESGPHEVDLQLPDCAAAPSSTTTTRSSTTTTTTTARTTTTTAD